jgi:hypothetical protein
VPLTDVIFLPSLPAKVIVVNGAKGQQPGQPFLELAARGSLALTGELPPAYAGQVKSGLKVKIFDEVTGIHATGTVAEIGTATTITPIGAIVNVGGDRASGRGRFHGPRRRPWPGKRRDGSRAGRHPARRGRGGRGQMLQHPGELQ